MTCCIAFKHKNKTYIGADSLITKDNIKSYPLNYSKLIKFPNAVCGWSGDTLVKKILEDLSKKKITNVYKFAKTVINKLKQDEEDFEVELLLCFKGKIYEIDEYAECFEVEVGAIGSGAAFALGALSVLLNNDDKDYLTPEQIIEMALTIAEDYDNSVGGPFIIEQI